MAQTHILPIKSRAAVITKVMSSREDPELCCDLEATGFYRNCPGRSAS